MNINLGPTPEPNFGETMESMQDEIDEHIEIMRGTDVPVSDHVMLLSDPEYPGAYRVWLTLVPPGGTIQGASETEWAWVNPDGEIITSRWPWAVA